MKNAYRIIPSYTGDVSGVCSALYELGGMVVMHDPSGCNSTYNTHDETRWYDQDSLIFISGFSEMDAIMGNDEKFVSEIVSAAESLRPKFIALASSPIPYMNGTDFPALARLIEDETGIPTFFVKTNGMHDYVQGAGNALAELAERFVRPAEERLPRSVNILGLTPLDFGAEGSEAALRTALSEADWQVISCWAMGDALDTMAEAGAASVNLVVSASGMAAARVLQRRFGTPWVAGIPVGAFRETLFAAMELAEDGGGNQIPYLHRNGEILKVTIIGEPVTMGSVAAAISERYSCGVRVICPLEADKCLIGPGDQMVWGEEMAEEALQQAEIVVADPLYRPICGEGAAFYGLPHEAFSGRCGWKTMKNLIGLDI